MREIPFLERLYIEMPGAPPGSIRAYVCTAAIIAVVSGLRLLLDPYISGLQVIFFFPAIVIATLLFGMRAGVFAGVLSAAAIQLFIMPAPPGQSALVAFNNLLVFALALGGVVAVVGALRTSLAQAHNFRALDLAIFNSNPDAVIVADTEGRIVRVNERTLKMFGYPHERLLGQAVEILVPERFRDRHIGLRNAFAADPRARAMGAGLELFARRATGEEFPVDVQIGPVQNDGGSQIIVSVRDITDEKLSAAALTESRRQQAVLEERQRSAAELLQANVKLAKIIEAAPVAIWAIDADERITIWNPGVASIYGITPADAIGKSWRELPSGRVPPDAQSSEALIQAAFEQDGFRDIEVKRFGQDGIEHELSMSSAILRDVDGQSTGMLYIAHDVGPTKELERKLRQAQKMEVVGQLTGGVAHDFNNLLAVIFGNLELLGERAEADPESMALVQEALTAAEHGAGLTQQLLAFSRLQQLAPTAVDVGALVTATIEMLRRMIEESVTIATTIAPDLWRSRIDSAQLANALFNLVVNARDAMPSGGKVTITAENAVLDEDYCIHYDEVVPGQYVKLSIADTGTGMPKATLDRATEPFFTTKAVGKGSGLGLSMVFGFIKQSGGHLSIYSEQDLGTTVSLYLPRLLDDTPHDTLPAEEPPPIASARQMILLVEDNEALRKLQIRMVTSLGYQTLEAADGASALELLDTAPHIDLLLTDVVLPGGISGPALAETAQSWRPDLKVIFMSGYAPQDVMQNYALSDSQCLTKPFTRATLARAVQETLAASPAVSIVT